MKTFISLSLFLLFTTTAVARPEIPAEEPEKPNPPDEKQQEEISELGLPKPAISSYQLSPCYTCYKDCKEKAAEVCYHTCPRKFMLSRLLSMCYEMCLLGNIDRCMLHGGCFQRKEIESLTGIRGGRVSADDEPLMQDIRRLLKRFDIPH